ncbi:MAG: ISAs1 family transposase [Rhodanobacter sp.]
MKPHSIAEHFADLEDPRVQRTQRHPLINVIVIGLCAVICGAEYFTEMEEFGEDKRDWLAKFLDLENGIPSHDTFNAVFARLKPDVFEQCLLSWVTSLVEYSGGEVIAIDGKTLRGSYDKGDSKAAVHMVSAWAQANHLSLGSVAVDEKSNEITAIPQLLDIIDVSGSLVTIDAMGCQKKIAEKIVDEGGDYVLAVKDNQPKLHAAIADYLNQHIENGIAEVPCRTHGTFDEGHGRAEERYYDLAKVPEDFALLKDWPHIKAIGMATNITRCGGNETVAVRYYIVSRYISGQRFANAVRGHWGIENNLHWQLDVSFGEDDLRLRRGHAPQNMSLLMRTALSLLKQEKTNRRGIKSKRKKAGWNTSYLEKVLFM